MCTKITYLEDDTSLVDVVADDSVELFATTFSTIFGLFGGRPLGLTGGLVLPPPATAAIALVLTDVVLLAPATGSSSSDSVELSGEKMLFFFESASLASAEADVALPPLLLAVDLTGGCDLMLPLAALLAADFWRPCNCCCCCLTTAGGALPPVDGGGTGVATVE